MTLNSLKKQKKRSWSAAEVAQSLRENTPTTLGRIKVIHKFTISCAQLSAPANGGRDKAISNTRCCD